jgi:hypothetical protein
LHDWAYGVDPKFIGTKDGTYNKIAGLLGNTRQTLRNGTFCAVNDSMRYPYNYSAKYYTPYFKNPRNTIN